MTPLIVQVRLIGCGYTNILREPGRIVPVGYTFHTPCPWGKERPDADCVHCLHHYEETIVQQPVDETTLTRVVQAAKEGPWHSTR